MSALHIVILAAGQGKRMRSDLPKVLHALAGRPLLAHVVATAERLQPAAVHVVHGHGGEQVRAALGALAVRWVEQPEQRGTGHALEMAMPGIDDDATVLVLYGDVPLVGEQTLREAAAHARAGGVALVTVTLDEPAGYGRILRDSSGRVQRIVEEKDADAGERRIGEINTGIVAAPARLLRSWLERLGDDNAQGERYLTDVIGHAVADGIGVATVSPGAREEVLGVNDRVQLAALERYYQRREAERLMLAGATVMDPARLDVRGEVETGRDVCLDVNVVLEGRVTLGDGVRIGANCCIRDADIGAGSEVLSGCVVEEARIGAGCRIGPFARIRPGTELGEDVHIGNFVEVKNTRVAARSKANHLTYLGDSEVGSDVNIGAGTITCNYDGANKHRTIIEDDVFIGSGVELVAPVRIHAGATVGAGSTISKDVAAGELALTRTKQVAIKRWQRPRKKD